MIGAFRASMLIVCAGALWLALAALANEPKRVYFYYPRAYVADTEVITYRVRVPIHGANRLLIVVAQDGEFEVQRSEFHVDERQSFYDAKFRLPAGEVYLLAALFGADREIARDTWKVTVYARLSGAADPDKPVEAFPARLITEVDGDRGLRWSRWW
jgi:hypothetical protein